MLHLHVWSVKHQEECSRWHSKFHQFSEKHNLYFSLWHKQNIQQSTAGIHFKNRKCSHLKFWSRFLVKIHKIILHYLLIYRILLSLKIIFHFSLGLINTFGTYICISLNQGVWKESKITRYSETDVLM